MEYLLNAATLALAAYLIYQPIKNQLVADQVNEVLSEMSTCMKHFDTDNCQAFNSRVASIMGTKQNDDAVKVDSELLIL